MKTKLILLLVFVLSSFNFQTASAQDTLLMGGCANGPAATTFQAFMTTQGATSSGLSCETVRSINDSISVVSMALIPTMALLRTPEVSAALAADLATAGLTFANPVVLSITIIGSVGVGTFYVVLRRSLEECEQQDREQLKQQLLYEIQLKFGAKPLTNVPLDIRN